VHLLARHEGKEYRWTYPSYEGRTEMSDEVLEASGASVEAAGPARIRTVLKANGRVALNKDRVKRAAPRFAGVIREVRKLLGETVAEGEVLAVIESNESLRSYELKSSLAGTVIEKRGVPGEFAGEGDLLYTVADLSTVWVDLDVYRADFPKVKAGQEVTVDAGEDIPKVKTTLSYLSPVGISHAQTLLARAVLPNPEGFWRPGLFVTGEIVVEETEVPLAVKASALQTFRDWTVVFVREGNILEIAPLELGRRDGAWVEVLSGLHPGQAYVAEGSFVIKADVMKSGATHDH
jgi:cobalt-zinc-cadmium efflux system membrane fusion protein